MHLRHVILGLTFFFLALTALGRDVRSDLVVQLRFNPQEGVDAPSPDLVPAMMAQPVTIEVEDLRVGSDRQRIGRGTNDDDEAFVIRSSAEPTAFFRETITRVLSDWGFESAEASKRTLRVLVTKYSVEEGNKAVGSSYSADVELRCVLIGAEGTTLAEAAGGATASRYGRARSADNCNEVLSDALKEALASALSDAGLQKAWGEGVPQAKSRDEGTSSIEERLAKLEALFKKGAITKEEYEKKRAEILGEL